MSTSYHAEKNTYTIGDFEGPLDLLLFLIKKNEVSIYDIPLAEITTQYLDYLNYTSKVDLENLTEFYVMAATLLFIKSRMLLPLELDLDDEIVDPRTELVNQLIEYQKFKKLSALIEEKSKDAEWSIERKKNQLILPFDDENMWEEIAIWDLLKYFSQLVANISSDRIIDLYEEVSINEKVTLVYEYLETRSDFSFTDLLTKGRGKLEIICSFLAILEMVKSKYIKIFQNKLFGDILIKKRVSEENNGFSG